jgi:glycerol 2-dehydrogenase (NADP+)
MNPNGDHPLFPKLSDGSRDIQWDRSHVDTYKDMEKLLDTGKVKAIGVCNYSKRYLDDLLPKISVVPAVNQIEDHPYLPQEELVDFCQSKSIVVTAYSPLGSTGSPLFQEEGIQKVAKKHGISEGTVCISYAVARGNVVIPKSVTPARIETNLKVVDLDKEDMDALNAIHKEKGVKRYVYPPFGVDLGFEDKPEGKKVV